MAHILIIEHNPQDYHAIRLMMDFAAHHSEVLTDGQQALDLLQRGTLPDAIITNVITAGLDGLLLCRAIKQNPKFAHIPVLLIAPPQSDNGENLARRAGASVLLRKPLQREQLLAEVDRAILMAPVQSGFTATPQEEAAFLRDYNAWLTRMLHKATTDLENATNTLELHEAHIQAIDRLTTALGSSLDVNEIAETLVQKIGEMMRAQAVALYEHRSDILYTLRYATGFGIPTPSIETHYLLDEDSPFYQIHDLAGSVMFAQRHNPLVNALGLNMIVQSSIISPLMAQGSLIGFVVVLSMDQVYNQEDAATLFSLGGVAGLALRNAHLFTHLEDAYGNLKDLDRRKSEFVAITSHELRTPIAIMLGYASLLSEIETDDIKKSQLNAIEKQANFLTGMVDMLINLHELQETSQRIQLRCVPIQLERLMNDALQVTLKHGNHRKTVHIKLDCDPVQIEGDEVRLMLAFGNMIDNAIKFSQDGTEARVQVAAHPNGGVVVTVEDHGIGIPAESLEKIFEPFYQLEPALTRRYGGMGVGLAITKGIVDLHGGTIDVKSKVGVGTRFIVTLPPRPPAERCAKF